MKFVIPRFQHTRTVKIVLSKSGDYCLVCDCPIFRRFKWACPHVYSIIERFPTCNDAHIRWHRSYNHFYGRKTLSREMSDQFVLMRDQYNLPGILLTEKEVCYIREGSECHPVGSGTKPLDFFLSTKDSLKIRGSDTYWHRQKNRLPDNLQASVQSLDVLFSDRGDNSEFGADNDNGSFGCDNSGLFEEVANDTHSAPPNIHCPAGASSLTHDASKYSVPSQDAAVQGLAAIPQGLSAKMDYDPKFTTICKLADSLGQDGRDLMDKYLNKLTKKLVKKRKNKGVTRLTNRRVAKRLKKVTSPPTKKKRAKH